MKSNSAFRGAGRSTFKPTLEGLEDRRVLSANLVGNTLFITQSNFNDTAVVTQAPVVLSASLRSNIVSLSNIKVQESIGGVAQPAKTFFAPFVHRIVYNGLDGNDRFDNQTSVPCTAYGGAGNDYLAGGHGADYLNGGSGNDELHGREGNDLMLGGSGNDLMRGGQGNDRMFGGTGKDDMFGALGNDFLDGGRDGSSDILRGGEGADTFVADNIRIIFFKFNRDKPQDFSAAQGDRII